MSMRSDCIYFKITKDRFNQYQLEFHSVDMDMTKEGYDYTDYLEPYILKYLEEAVNYSQIDSWSSPCFLEMNLLILFLHESAGAVSM
jgi:hypothetical protein